MQGVRYAFFEPGLMKIRIILRQKNPKTRGIDMQKWTLAFICYAHFWRAYNTQFSRAYDTQLHHNPNPTHRVA